MKKKNVINLIRYHADNNEAGFRKEAYIIAEEFEKIGDSELAEYIMGLMACTNTLIPTFENNDTFFERLPLFEEPLLLPTKINLDLQGVINAIHSNLGIHTFLFQGAPGTGKTEAVKRLALTLNREVFAVNFASIIDSKLGQTQKNIATLFEEINALPQPDKVIILFDELDALALDRTNHNDLREMGRATSSLLKGFDQLHENVILIATTNLYDHFDEALLRRFSSTINFNQYDQETLLELAERFHDYYLNKQSIASRDIRLFRKIIQLQTPIPNPGTLKNMIKSSIAFSDKDDPKDYLRRLYTAITNQTPDNLQQLKDQHFTLREIEILTKKPKSSVSRQLKGSYLL